jgi:hypothetical protein
VIVNDFHVVGVPFPPQEADTPPVINPDAVLPRTISAKGFEPIAGRSSQIAQFRGGIQLGQLSLRDSFERQESLDSLAIMETPGILRTERPDHTSRV